MVYNTYVYIYIYTYIDWLCRHIGLGKLHEKENEDNGEAELPMELLQVPDPGSVPTSSRVVPQLHYYLYTF